jgi:predicted secreted protein
MKVSIVASTKMGYEMPIPEALDFGGKSAGICYMPNDFQSILNEPQTETQKRIDRTLNSKHHSVYDHPTYNLVFEDIPKFIAMILNNEKNYATSEKSARYTKMNPTPRELEYYNKWLEKFKNIIHEKYPQIKSGQVEKLAQENARYMISVFTPTTMEHTLNLKQINYIIRMMNKYISETSDTPFVKRVKEELHKFVTAMTMSFYVEGMDYGAKNRELSLFDHREVREEQFGENYCVTYWGSFAMLAQAQRHRTIDYKMWFDESKMTFYTPTILSDNVDLIIEWISDIQSLGDLYPQGLLVRITERSTYENFLLKCTERLCGCAQLEIMNRTKITFQKYIDSSAECFEKEVTDKGYGCTPRCKFPNWICNSPCIWGPNNAFTRKI